MSVSILGPCFTSEPPMRSVQLIWLKLVLESIVKASMNCELKVADIIRFVDRKPHKMNEPMFTKLVLI
jgi:magnesium-transporting ATPase (P-type)